MLIASRADGAFVPLDLVDVAPGAVVFEVQPVPWFAAAVGVAGGDYAVAEAVDVVYLVWLVDGGEEVDEVLGEDLDPDAGDGAAVVAVVLAAVDGADAVVVHHRDEVGDLFIDGVVEAAALAGGLFSGRWWLSVYACASSGHLGTGSRRSRYSGVRAAPRSSLRRRAVPWARSAAACARLQSPGGGVVDSLEDVALYLGGGVFDLFQGRPGGGCVHVVVTSWGGREAPWRVAPAVSVD